jgi:hypothetical protein
VNFYAHVSIATLYAADEAMALGAMLPDLASLLGVKPPPTTHPGIHDGYVLHHVTDAVFHDLPLFRLTCREQCAHLTHLGLKRGPARAAAHVGLEFLLDDAPALDAPTHQLFCASLASATTEGLAAKLDWQSRENAEQFQNLRNRLLAAELSPHGLAANVVAERIFRTLLSRPRLAIRSEQVDILTDWIQSLRRQGTGIFCSFVEQVISELSSRIERPQTRSADSLQFRRAWVENL